METIFSSTISPAPKIYRCFRFQSEVNKTSFHVDTFQSILQRKSLTILISSAEPQAFFLRFASQQNIIIAFLAYKLIPHSKEHLKFLLQEVTANCLLINLQARFEFVAEK